MDTSDDMAEKSNKWLDSVSKTYPRLLDLFPACNPLSSPAVAARDIPPPANLGAGIRDLSSALDPSCCFLELNNNLDVNIFELAKENPDQISAEEMRTTKQVTKRLGKKQPLKLSLDQVENQHLLKRQDLSYPNPNPKPNCSCSDQTTILNFTNNQMYAIPHQVQAVPSAYQEATKEARKKRMAKMRSRSGKDGQHQVQAVPPSYQEATKEARKKRMAKMRSRSSKDVQQQEESVLKFLLKRVLKKSDLGSPGRIVLPKKVTEDNLPVHGLGRDGTVIAVQDLKTSWVWNMRLSFWSKPGMYVFENTEDFVRANRLEAGDFIMLYMDTRNGKYMIRSVKMPAEDMKPPSRRKAKNKS